MDKIDLNRSQKQMIQVMTKYTILIVVALFSEFIVGVFSIIRFQLEYGSKKDLNTLMYPCTNWISIDCLINILSFQTQFNFWGQSGFKKLCGRCQRAAMQPFIHVEMKKLHKRKELTKSEIQTHGSVSPIQSSSFE